MDSGPSPYSGIEHESFLSALSKKDSTWFRESGLRGAIHSFRYFLLLQAQLPRHLLESSDIGSTNKNNWTFEDELAFERGLSEIEENDPSRWDKIAASLPGGKYSALHIQDHYQQLLIDLQRIEFGEFITVHYLKGGAQ